MKYFFIGINGSGMSSLAKIVKDLGYEVDGYDYNLDNDMIYDYSYKYVVGNYFLNSDIFKTINNLGYNYITYPKLLDSLFDNINICVSGSHGKTTTTKMISSILDCSYLIGDKSGRAVDSDFFVYEGCEYKNSNLNYHPTIGVLTNCDYDHVDFFDSIISVFNNFKQFALNCEVVFVNGDDIYLNKLDNVIKFGEGSFNDIVFSCFMVDGGYNVTIDYFNKLYSVFLNVSAKYMVYNFMATYCVCRYLNISHNEIIKRFENYKNPSRRFEVYDCNNKVYIFDYAHHPTELNCLYESVCNLYKDEKITIVFQPHTYTRTIKFKNEFKDILLKFDKCYLMDVFNSREDTDPKLQKDIDCFFQFDKVSNVINDFNKVIIFAGAGDIYDTFIKIAQ